MFEAALNVDVRQLSDEVAPVLLLAVIGVIVCTLVVGLALWPIAPVGILACVILGAIIATTDPVAVVAIFHDIGAPRRLSTLVQGESLFNDAAAIAIYSLAVAMLAGDRPASPLDGLVTFVREFGGGLAAGLPRRMGGHPVHPYLAGEPLGRGDADDRLCLCHLYRLRPLPRASRGSSRSPPRRSPSAPAAGAGWRRRTGRASSSPGSSSPSGRAR